MKRDKRDTLFERFLAENKEQCTLRNVFKAGFDAAAKHPQSETVRLVIETENRHYRELIEEIHNGNTMTSQRYSELVTEWIDRETEQ